MHRLGVEHALVLGVVLAFVALVVGSCGGPGEPEPRPLPEDQQALRPGEYRSEESKDVVGWFRRHPHLKTDEPEPVTVGGSKGAQFDVVVGDPPEDHSGECGSDCVDVFRFSSGGPPLALSEGYKGRLIVLEDVGDETVIVGFASPAAEFDEHAPQAQKVIDTVQWRGE
jgi:hypothetical protein